MTYRKSSSILWKVQKTLHPVSNPVISQMLNASTFQLILQSCYKNHHTKKFSDLKSFANKKEMELNHEKFSFSSQKKGKKEKDENLIKIFPWMNVTQKKVGKLLTSLIPIQFRNPIKLNNNKKKCEERKRRRCEWQKV